MKYLIFSILLCTALYLFKHDRYLKKPTELRMKRDTIQANKKRLVGSGFQSASVEWKDDNTYTIKHNY